MKALVVTKHGGPEVMRVLERPDPSPGRDEVRIAVRAAGLNFSDLMARAGAYPGAPKPPCVVGYEVAGVIDRVGEDVRGWAVGDRVVAGSRFGGQAELVVTHAANVVGLPGSWTYEEGAAFPVAYTTAYAALVRYGTAHPGERVLIHAAAGGVGIAATQVARRLGLEIFGTASASKHRAIEGFGVEHVIDYHAQDFVQEARRLTGVREPLDLVMDPIGGRSYRKSFSLLRPGGRLVCFGLSAAIGEQRSPLRAARTMLQMPRFSSMKLMVESKIVLGLNMLPLWDSKGTLGEFIEPLADWIADGTIRPQLAESFHLEQAAGAHRYVHDRQNVGKVVLTINPG